MKYITFHYLLETQRYYSPELGRYISEDPIRLASGETSLFLFVENTTIDIDLLDLACSQYATRSKASLKSMRKRFNKSGRKRFLKKLGQNVDELRKKGFSDVEIHQIQRGKVPKGYIVHHKVPLFRGSDNRLSNLDLMSERIHQKFFKELHYYDGNVSPYYVLE